MSVHIEETTAHTRLRLCWILLAATLGTVILPYLVPGLVSRSLAISVQEYVIIAWALLHGSVSNGWRGIAIYFLLALPCGFLAEASAIANGFPFGYYVHNSASFQLWGVPWYVPWGYAIFGWVAWMLARIVIREHPLDAGGTHRFTTPLVAVFIFAAWSFVFDPIGATAWDLYTYRYPSGQFGVPLSNTLGWFLVGGVTFSIFAWFEPRFPPDRAGVRRSGFWLQPCLLWLVIALQYPLLWAFSRDGTVTLGNSTFVVSDIFEASVGACLLTMVFIAIVALVRIGTGQAKFSRGEDTAA